MRKLSLDDYNKLLKKKEKFANITSLLFCFAGYTLFISFLLMFNSFRVSMWGFILSIFLAASGEIFKFANISLEMKCNQFLNDRYNKRHKKRNTNRNVSIKPVIREKDVVNSPNNDIDTLNPSMDEIDFFYSYVFYSSDNDIDTPMDEIDISYSSDDDIDTIETPTDEIDTSYFSDNDIETIETPMDEIDITYSSDDDIDTIETPIDEIDITYSHENETVTDSSITDLSNEDEYELTEWEKEHQSELLDQLFRIIDSMTGGESEDSAPIRHSTVFPFFNRSGNMPSNYVVFDLETTGLSFSSSDIIEIGAIKYIEHSETERFHSYVSIPYNIPLFITDLTGITDEMISDAPSISEILPSFIEFIGDLPLVAHNRRFDMIFIQTALFENGYDRLFNETVDTVKLAQKYLPQLVNHKLPTIKDYFNLDYTSHNALDDCMVTSYLYKYCFDKYTSEHKNDPKPSEFDNAIFKTVCDIINKHNYDTSLIKIFCRKNYVDITYEYYEMLRFKTTGKLKYWLIDMDYETFNKTYNTDIHHTISSKSEQLKTRLFIEKSSQLYDFQDYIIKEYQKCKESYDHYYNHIMK